MHSASPVAVLTAPTAAGKTGMAIELALETGRVEIVSADAFLVYRGLDVGTAKPDLHERRGVPHHLLDVTDVTESYDVARYVQEAQAAIADILERGNTPLLVGGTGFYLSALMKGLPLTPKSEPEARAALELELAERGLDALLAEIERSNPQEARRMERNPRRVLRALEVKRQTGRWPGEFGSTTPGYRYRVTAFSPPLDLLERRISERTAAMFAAGWPEEAAWLAGQVSPDTSPRPTVWQTLGYEQALSVARGELSVQEAQAQVHLATRQYAKRQLTWIRKQLGADILGPDQARRQAASWLAGE
ncbi:tRNA (adenosine(37)-N6)-dimethylallyltransferase MiaA [Deinococcus altitudinis]|uniref:tRNA (adenosine(37)-N6)-dimethylallyltransferase MiaA n=1 Tax=Deinococcus altitudinis TaxID=468914 RepID=UPI0038923AF0